jgi:hypothetical protein
VYENPDYELPKRLERVTLSGYVWIPERERRLVVRGAKT